MSQDRYDVVVIGGGHAGTEAAHASARMGCETALVTLDLDRIGLMSCNPAMGGLAKGQLIKEIDALGGLMGRNTDQTAIQYRRLNMSKGPAVRSSRAQCDKLKYAKSMQNRMHQIPRLHLIEDEVTGLVIEQNQVVGVMIRGEAVRAKAVVITSGTFLRAIMHTGENRERGGRVGEKDASILSKSLETLGFRLRRLKTGTPPRLHRGSIDWDRTEPQPGDDRPVPFSFYERPEPFPLLPQIHCFITHTNQQTHEIIANNTHLSPMYSGAITGVGPRYCPSIEDKVNRFRDKPRHQIFLEPEGLDVDDVYVNGVSTSLPREVQRDFIRSVQGLEKAEFLQFGYAVEYDAVDARQLKATLESKEVSGLFLAGQVNGTSGYEEAGAQGLIAGINAAQRVLGRDEFVLTRLEGYAGVLIDDLILKGSDEPYRMFTSRAEYRLLLREDNADLRLGEQGWKLGLLSDGDYKKLEAKRNSIAHWKSRLSETYLKPNEETHRMFEENGWAKLKDRVSVSEFMRRPEIHWKTLEKLGILNVSGVDPLVSEQIEIQIKYEGYIKRDLELLRGVQKNEKIRIPQDLCFEDVPGLSNEIRGKLEAVRPETLGQTSRVQGVTPAAVANLMIYLKQNRRKSASGRALD